MKAWWPLVVAVLLPGGLIIAALELWRRHRSEQRRSDLVPRWGAFITSPAADGEPTIAPANLPAVRERKAVVQRVERFRYRLTGRS